MYSDKLTLFAQQHITGTYSRNFSSDQLFRKAFKSWNGFIFVPDLLPLMLQLINHTQNLRQNTINKDNSFPRLTHLQLIFIIQTALTKSSLTSTAAAVPTLRPRHRTSCVPWQTGPPFRSQNKQPESQNMPSWNPVHNLHTPPLPNTVSPPLAAQEAGRKDATRVTCTETQIALCISRALTRLAVYS